MQLYEMAKLIRSKNAGPFLLTIDVMFDDESSYERVRDSGILRAERVAEVYRLEPNEVQVFDYRPALALKITLPRPVVSGGQRDNDVYGGQFHSPLVTLEVPPAGDLESREEGATGE